MSSARTSRRAVTVASRRALAVASRRALAAAAALAVAATVAGAASRADAAVEYRVDLAEREHNHVLIDMTVRGAPSPLELSMPIWTPGAYEVRTWGKNVTPLSATDGDGHPLRFERTGPSTFRVTGHHAPADVHLRYRVFAAVLSDDASQVDAGHAYLNGTSIFLAARGSERDLHAVRIAVPAGWRVGTALEEAPDGWQALGYEPLVDAPIEVGRFADAEVRAAGRVYRVAIDGASEVPPQLLRDVAAIADAEARAAGTPPYRRYFVLIHLADGLGRMAALEHAASTSILVPHRALGGGEAYSELLYVVAHELFHAWNARRLRPAELTPVDFARTVPARSLWITEGLTEYYAHRALRVAGKWSRARYLERLGEEATRAVAAARLGLTIEEEAELAWQPPDEAALDPDAYYARGHLVALALDARIRALTDGARSLDDVLHALLADADRAGGVLPVDGDVLARAVARVAPGAAGDVAAWTRAPGEPTRLRAALASLGLELDTEELPARTIAGFSAEPDGDSLRVALVAPSGPAARAGLKPGDRIVLIGGAQPTAKWANAIAQKSPGAALMIEAVRAARRMVVELRLDAARPLVCRVVESGATPRATQLRDALLGR
jgi:predicted metalloprotease with PDZ domain